MVDPSSYSKNSVILSIRDLVVRRGGGFKLRVNALDLFSGEILAVIGPNGAGKSTLLLTISKLLQPSNGQIFFGGVDLNTLNTLGFRRKIALVLQKPLLFNTSVYNNIATGLRFRGLPSIEIDKRVNEWMLRLNIGQFRDRHASTLSGGQAQRTSLARALVLEPNLLLLDEPFGALDSPTRKSLMEELRHLLHDSGISSIFITHDQDEALYFGDRVAILLNGDLSQVGLPHTILSNPSDPIVAEFVGVENILPGRVSSRENGRIRIEIGDYQFDAVGDYSVGKNVLFCLRPEDIILLPAGQSLASSARNAINGLIKKMVTHGPLVHVTIDCGFPLIALITRASANELELIEDSQIGIAFKSSAVHLIPK